MASTSISRGSATSEIQIEVFWSALTTEAETGGSAILSYNLQYDQGGNLWTDLAGFTNDYTLLTYTVTDNLALGVDYQFRIKARNIYGWAALFSDPVKIIKASGVPA